MDPAAMSARIARGSKVARGLATLAVVIWAYWVGTYVSLWWLLLTPLVWGITFIIVMFFVGMYIAATSDPGELELPKTMPLDSFDGAFTGKLDPDNPEHVKEAEKEGLLLGRIVAVSSEIACRYLGEEVPEWLDVSTGEGTIRLHFDSVAPRDGAGNFLPTGEVGTALINGVIYKRQAESAST